VSDIKASNKSRRWLIQVKTDANDDNKAPNLSNEAKLKLYLKANKQRRTPILA